MADTSQPELSEPHTNGVVDGLTEEEKSKMRPADIDADMREMERRKRVEMMMNSRLFREELERIIETQMKDGSGPSGLLQQISEMMGPQGARFNANVFKNSNCVVPINDIRGVESMGYAKGEKLLRCKLAAVFRLLDLYGWTQGVGGQITARLNQDQEHFLVNPYGLLYHEVTASSLVKVDMQGAVVEQGTTNFGVHIAGFQLHSTIHAARPDIKCIVHIATPSVTAISSMKCGLLPLGQESIVIGEVSNHQYVGGSFEPEEREKITRNLGPISKVMLLTNRGALCCGETVEEAFFNVYNTVLACETQLKLMPAGLDNMNLISEESKKAIFEASRKPPIPHQASIVEPSPLAEKLEKRWRIGGTEFEALMRMLDNAGFRTGYIYRHPLVKSEPPRPRNDVEVPPAVSSLGYLLEEEELYKQGLWKGGRKGTDRTRWLNSPNVYQKVEILETGTPDPKKITKWVDQSAEEWVTDGSPTHSSTPVKIDCALQFVPKNTNPKEFKQLQQQIKDYRRADKISAGPQSHILEGVTWEEAKKMQDATISGTGEQVVLVGAASKGIIQRGFQHNAMVYKTPYAKNPFDAITDQELDQYKKDVERKAKGDPYDESQSESEALSSFNVSRATHESSTAKSPIQSPVSVTSETEEESRDEPRVLRIATKQVPVPSQPEVVLSDVDATTEFLNEMRRSTIESRNNVNKRDNGRSSTCSSEIEGLTSSSWQSSESVDKPHLEVTRTTTIAEVMKPVLMKIEPTSLSSKVENILVQDEHSRPFHNTRHNILKRAFLDDYDKRINKNNLLDNFRAQPPCAVVFNSLINEDKLLNNNICNNSNAISNLNGSLSNSVKVNGTAYFGDKNRNNAKKHLTKKINPVIKDYEDLRDENVNITDVMSETEHSLLENDNTKLKDIGNISKTFVNRSKKRCVRKLKIPSQVPITSVDCNYKNCVIKTHFQPLIPCSDVMNSTDSDSVSGTKTEEEEEEEAKFKNDEIITVDCNTDYRQEMNFTQQINIDLEEQVESDLESGPLSSESLSEPLQAPILVQKVLDSNFKDTAKQMNSHEVNKSDLEEEGSIFNEAEQVEKRFIINEYHVDQNISVSILRNEEDLDSSNETIIMENSISDDNLNATQNKNEIVKFANDLSNQGTNKEIIKDDSVEDFRKISNQLKESVVYNEVSEVVKELINSAGGDSKENAIPTTENKTNEKTTITTEFNNSDQTNYKDDQNNSSMIAENENTDEIVNSLINNESFHLEAPITETISETNRHVQSELQISSNSNEDKHLEEVFLYFSEILLATEKSETFETEVISPCEEEGLEEKDSLGFNDPLLDSNENSDGRESSINNSNEDKTVFSIEVEDTKSEPNIKKDLVSDEKEEDEVISSCEEEELEKKDSLEFNDPLLNSNENSDDRKTSINNSNEDETVIAIEVEDTKSEPNIKKDLVSDETEEDEVISSCEEEGLEEKDSLEFNDSLLNSNENSDDRKTSINNSNEDETVIAIEVEDTKSEPNIKKDLVSDEKEENKVNEQQEIVVDHQQNSATEDKNQSVHMETDKTNLIENTKIEDDITLNFKVTSQDFVKEISSSREEKISFSAKEEESFYLNELFSRCDNKTRSKKSTDEFDDIFNTDFENMEGFEGFPLQSPEGVTNVGNIEAFIDDIFSFKHSDLDIDKLFSKVYKKIVHEKEEKSHQNGVQNSANKNSPKNETLNTCLGNENIQNNVELVSPTSSSKFLERRDSITDIIDNINVYISSSKTTCENLPETDNSLKYNLDPTNMSLIYSLTPSADVSSKKGVSSKNTSIEMMGLSLGSFEEFDQLDSSRTLKHDLFDWLDLASVKIQKDDILNIQKQLSLIKSCPNINILIDSLSEETFSDFENNSTQGSDILELPSSTYLELKKTEDESFRHELNTTVNEILNDLEKTEIYTNATNFVDDIVYDISCLNIHIDLKNLKREAKLLTENRIHGFFIVKDIVERLISNLPYNNQEGSSSQIESNLQSDVLENIPVMEEANNLDNFIVIREIVHHIIDKFDCDSPVVYIPKKLKETVNSELKKYPNKDCNGNALDEEEEEAKEENGLVGLLKNIKDDDILPCYCVDCLPKENRELAEVQKDKECLKQFLNLMSDSQNQNFKIEEQNSEAHSLEEDSLESDGEDDVLNLRNKLITMFPSDNDKNKKYVSLPIKLKFDESLDSNSCEDLIEFPEKTGTFNSSPSEIQSAESENFAEQEVTSESTDNDTKSDNSKEKESLKLDTFVTDKIRTNEVLNDQDVKCLWDIRENKIEENCKIERFQYLEKSPSFIHFGDFEEKERTFCACCFEVSIEDDSPPKLPPIEEMNESLEFVNCEETLKPFDQSLISPRSAEFFTCRDASESWKSNTDKPLEIDTTKELIDKLEDPFEEIDYDENQNATYTISDVSDNEKSVTSELEYNADVSSNLEPRKLGESVLEKAKEDNDNDTTLNFADVSASTMISDGDLKKPAKWIEINKQNYYSLACENFETSQELESTYKNPADYMTYSYDTKEFMKLEKHLEEQDSVISCNLKKNEIASLSCTPKYEDTTLYRVVTQMNLADTASFSSTSIKNDSDDILE